MSGFLPAGCEDQTRNAGGLSATDLKTVPWVFGGAETKDTSLGSSDRGMQPVEALELLC